MKNLRLMIQGAWVHARRVAIITIAMGLIPLSGHTQTIDIQSPWARASVPGQYVSSVYMKLLAASGARLVGVSTPVAATARLHEMRFDGTVMHMREITDGVYLPAGRTVELTPNSIHIMLTELKHPLQKDTHFKLALIFEDAQGGHFKREILVPVFAIGESSAGPTSTTSLPVVLDHAGMHTSRK